MEVMTAVTSRRMFGVEARTGSCGVSGEIQESALCDPQTGVAVPDASDAHGARREEHFASSLAELLRELAPDGRCRRQHVPVGRRVIGVAIPGDVDLRAIPRKLAGTSGEQCGRW